MSHLTGVHVPTWLADVARGGATAAGIASCYTYRAAVYNMLGLTGYDRVKKERNPPHHLVIWDRKGRRGFINIDEIIA